MEILAYTHLSIVCEEGTHPECEQNSFQKFNWKLPNSTETGLLSALMILSILGSASSTLAAYVKTNNSPLNVRSGPGLGYRVVNTLPSSTYVNLSGRRVDAWSQLANGNWVYSPWIVGEGGGGTGGGVPSTILRSGSRGDGVVNLQNRLDTLGFYNGPITGYYGRLTEAAVREFQSSRRLLVDSIAGTQTLASLYGDGAGGTSGGSPTVDTARVATNNSPLNVRSGPGLGYRVVDTLANGAFINLSDRSVNGWSQLAKGNWVDSRWIRT
ncbi:MULTISPECIES: peptidoglycan-binding protein [unclassified Coleofasciculus]|uniref:peptidoglycan-binding protein n=1 Tax=unclassified Coleofasciculus TaxID=2692782 RepID=UPI00187FEA3D|nr:MULTISPECIES: peptidoglycan-binding protein [unclassified Coleofasciculus]MBE9128905.1 peptidoglycan-binding protein [Coleofasciculus sp. LEGE 07081]MBE9151654.1 peptidoglycan-binding protein [Coleofasciculus sp. LEGE 07092]